MGKENVPPLNDMLDEYYEVRGWDNEGVPTAERLSQLNLKECLPSNKGGSKCRQYH